jgi:ribosomal protein S18 acetylase RimI-like enzyme
MGAIAISLHLVTDFRDPFLLQLYGTTRELEMNLLPWPAEQKENFLTSQYESREIHYSRVFPKAQNFVICLEDKPIGRLYLDRGDLEIRIVDFALLPEYRGLGIGTNLVRELQREVMETGKVLTGSVDRMNRAVNFWQRLGFQLDESTSMYLPMAWRPPANSDT